MDGCKGGWVVVSQAANQELKADVFPSFRQVVNQNYDLLIVDIPIGLPDKGAREADRAARTILGKRHVTVFNAPLRPMLACSEYLDAKDCGRRIHGKTLSKQSWAIIPKIREVDDLLGPKTQSRIREGHPEVSFTIMNGGQPVAESKHTNAGEERRIRLLQSHFPSVCSLINQHRRNAEDVIDACALLWTAQRIRQNCAEAFPGEPPEDAHGLAMQIWA